MQVVPINVHPINVKGAGAIGNENDVATVVRNMCPLILESTIRQLSLIAAISVHDPDMAAAARRRVVNDPAVRCPINGGVSILPAGSGRELFGAARIAIRRNPDVRSRFLLCHHERTRVRGETQIRIVVEIAGEPVGLATGIREIPNLRSCGHHLLSSDDDQTTIVWQPLNIRERNPVRSFKLFVSATIECHFDKLPNAISHNAGDRFSIGRPRDPIIEIFGILVRGDQALSTAVAVCHDQ